MTHVRAGAAFEIAGSSGAFDLGGNSGDRIFAINCKIATLLSE
jgi:hypothetical protein